MKEKICKFDAVIQQVEGNNGAYICFPYDIRKEFGRGRVKVQATFDGVVYQGSIVNMGVKKATVPFAISSGYEKRSGRKSANRQAIAYL